MVGKCNNSEVVALGDNNNVERKAPQYEALEAPITTLSRHGCQWNDLRLEQIKCRLKRHFKLATKPWPHALIPCGSCYGLIGRGGVDTHDTH